MENIILSILLLKSMTVYELRTYIQKNLRSVCSDSLGSLQTAIKKLIDKGCIRVYEYTDNNIFKKEYSISDNGIEQFQKWISTPVNLQKVKNMEEGKLFFLGLATKAKRISSLEGYIRELKVEQDKLLQIESHMNNMKNQIVNDNVKRISKDDNLHKKILQAAENDSLEKVINTIFDYQIYMLKYGLTRVKSDIEFYTEILKEESTYE